MFVIYFKEYNIFYKSENQWTQDPSRAKQFNLYEEAEIDVKGMYKSNTPSVVLFDILDLKEAEIASIMNT